jgi:hypothetical protein
MSCCGQARSRITTGAGRAGVARSTTFLFEYVGRTRLIVIGPTTRNMYRFERTGARVLVDGRDRASLVSLPALRQVGT